MVPAFCAQSLHFTMPKLLSIAIPTYNRAKMLDTQLAWLFDDLRGIEAYCNIIVNDNCSADGTPQVISKWKEKFQDRKIEFIANRHDHNIGGMANIESCLRYATGTYVWTLGDDDMIKKDTAPYIIELLKKYENLTMIMLDGVGVDQITGEVKYERLFSSTTDKPNNGISEFEYFLENTLAGILCISSAIYLTRLAQEACMTWPNSHENFAAQVYWVAFCAARGNFVITPSQHTEVAMGIGFSDTDSRMSLRLVFMGTPEVFMNLMNVGYSRSFCLKKVYANLLSIGAHRVLFGGMRHWFSFAVGAYVKYLGVVFKAPFVAASHGLNRKGMSSSCL